MNPNRTKAEGIISACAVACTMLMILTFLLFVFDWSIDARNSVGVKLSSSPSEREQGFFHAQSASAIWDFYGVVIFDRQVTVVFTRDSKIHHAMSSVVKAIAGVFALTGSSLEQLSGGEVAVCSDSKPTIFNSSSVAPLGGSV